MIGCLVAKMYSVPHEESRKMFLFIVHFASFLQNFANVYYHCSALVSELVIDNPHNTLCHELIIKAVICIKILSVCESM